MEKFSLIVVIALALHAEPALGQSSPQPNVSAEVHAKAVELIEVSGSRNRMLASFPGLIEQGKAEMRKQLPNCDAAYFTEWGNRMAARLNVEDFVDVAVRAYEKRFTNDELTQLTLSVRSKKTDRPTPLSPAMQKKMLDLLPAITGEIVGGCTELGARLGGQVGAEIEKEHPEYFARAKSPKP